MNNSDDQIIQALVELNMRIEAYFEQLAEDKPDVEKSEKSVFQLLQYLRDEGYTIKSSFYGYCNSRIKELQRIYYEKDNSDLKTGAFRTMKNKFREILIKRDLQTYLETCEPGVNFSLEVGDQKIIHFKPSLSVITNIKIMIYEDFGI